MKGAHLGPTHIIPRASLGPTSLAKEIFIRNCLVKENLTEVYGQGPTMLGNAS